MRYASYILVIILAGLFAWSLLLNKETTLEKQLLQREIKAIENRLHKNDSIIELSEKREKALLVQYIALERLRDSTEVVAVKSIKLLQRERKRKTPVFATDSAYTLAIDSLFSPIGRP